MTAQECCPAQGGYASLNSQSESDYLLTVEKNWRFSKLKYES